MLLTVNDYLKVFLEQQVPTGDSTTSEEQAARQQKEGSIRLAIRRDLYPKTTIDEHWISKQWKPIASSEKAINEYLQRHSKNVS